MAIKLEVVKTTADLSKFVDNEGFIPTRDTDTAEDWGFDRDSREWMLFVKEAVVAVRQARKMCA